MCQNNNCLSFSLFLCVSLSFRLPESDLRTPWGQYPWWAPREGIPLHWGPSWLQRWRWGQAVQQESFLGDKVQPSHQSQAEGQTAQEAEQRAAEEFGSIKEMVYSANSIKAWWVLLVESFIIYGVIFTHNSYSSPLKKLDSWFHLRNASLSLFLHLSSLPCFLFQEHPVGQPSNNIEETSSTPHGCECMGSLCVH